MDVYASPIRLRCLRLSEAAWEGELYIDQESVYENCLDNDCKVLREDLTLFRHSVSSQFPSWEDSWLSFSGQCVWEVRKRQHVGVWGGRRDCQIRI